MSLPVGLRSLHPWKFWTSTKYMNGVSAVVLGCKGCINALFSKSIPFYILPSHTYIPTVLSLQGQVPFLFHPPTPMLNLSQTGTWARWKFNSRIHTFLRFLWVLFICSGSCLRLLCSFSWFLFVTFLSLSSYVQSAATVSSKKKNKQKKRKRGRKSGWSSLELLEYGILRRCEILQLRRGLRTVELCFVSKRNKINKQEKKRFVLSSWQKNKIKMEQACSCWLGNWAMCSAEKYLFSNRIFACSLTFEALHKSISMRMSTNPHKKVSRSIRGRRNHTHVHRAWR